MLRGELTADGIRARVKLALGKTHQASGFTLVYGPFTLYPVEERVTFAGRESSLRGDLLPTLRRLLVARGAAVGYHKLLDWRMDEPREKARRASKSRVARLRRRLGAAGGCIVSVPGVGYRVEL